ncbi:MAG: F0F1 ATP synthase subunit A [Candidatus Omnitrophota bacterium]|nr:F0F1 ATP synthase subunit A [Candidatus Omnitrophota bacterium]
MEESINVIIRTFRLPYTDLYLNINPFTLKMTWIVIGIVILGMLLLKRRLTVIPDRRQSFLEVLSEWFDNMLTESLGEDGRNFLPFIMTLFLFVLVSNLLSIIPTLNSPTADLNTCFGLGILVFFIAHISAIRKMGFRNYFRRYFKPFWWLFPSNMISEFSKTLSHSLRLFGNIFAGGLMLSFLPFIIKMIPRSLGIPLNLTLMPIVTFFFGIVVGCIQAFVFTILAVAYISVLRY